MMQEKRRRKFHAFNKNNSFILLRYAYSLLHFTQLLCCTFYDYILYIIYHYIYLSLISLLISLQICYSFLWKFVLLYLYALFFLYFSFSLGVFSCQYYAGTHMSILCNFFVFLSILFHSLWTFTEFFFFRGSEREKI